MSILALLMVAFACGGQSETQSGQRGFDESSIDDVWHRAKLRGVAYRAIGQEPGCLLEITNGSEILLVTDYGENRNSYSQVDPVVDQGKRRTQYVLEGQAPSWKSGGNTPPEAAKHYSGKFDLRIGGELHVRLAMESKKVSGSLNTYCVKVLRKDIGS